MQALVAQAPPHNVLRATPSFSAEFGAAAGGAVAVSGPGGRRDMPRQTLTPPALALDWSRLANLAMLRFFAISFRLRSRLSLSSVSLWT